MQKVTCQIHFSTKDQDVNPFSTKDPVVDMVEKLELERTAIFDKAGSKIAKSTKTLC